MSSRKFVVYKILCKANRKFYIGSTENYELRYKHHMISGYNSNIIVQNCRLKYPGLIEMYILRTFDNSKDMKSFESHLIGLFHSSPLCMNIAKDARGLTSEEAKELRAKHNNCNSPDIVKKRRVKQKVWYDRNKQEFINKNYNNKKVKVVLVTEPTGFIRIIRGFRNIQFIYPELKSSGNISYAIKGKIPHYKGFKFRELDTDF